MRLALSLLLASCAREPAGAPALPIAPPPAPAVVAPVDPGVRVPPAARQGIVEIAVGERVSCARLDDGAVRCWGDDTDGRAGLGERALATFPTLVEGLPPAAAITVGDRHGCVLDREGHAHCWGDNTHGQLGDGTTTSRARPARVEGLDDVVELDAAAGHTCARTRDDAVWCWGRALHLGVGDDAPHPRPTRLPGLRGVARVVLGHEGGCAILADRTVRCWGFNGSAVFGARPGPFARAVPVLGSPAGSVPVHELALGGRHVCVVLADGHVECAGSDRGGELADQSVPDDATCETREGQVTCTWVERPPPEPPPPPGSPMPPDLWPPPARPELPARQRTFPERRGFDWAQARGHDVVADGAYGTSRTCWIADDRVECFGVLHRADWAHRRATPIEGTLGAIQLDVSAHHGCAVLRDHRAVCWGQNHAGELGDGTTTSRDAAAPVTW
jgi:alpha-tubulin suppressor-like RCC1 family protein